MEFCDETTEWQNAIDNKSNMYFILINLLILE